MTWGARFIISNQIHKIFYSPKQYIGPMMVMNDINDTHRKVVIWKIEEQKDDSELQLFIQGQQATAR